LLSGSFSRYKLRRISPRPPIRGQKEANFWN
jgi:hypothetical protein